MAEWVKLPSRRLVSHVRALVQVLAVPLLTPFPAHDPGKTAYEPRNWSCDIYMGDLAAISGCWLIQPGPASHTAAI